MIVIRFRFAIKVFLLLQDEAIERSVSFVHNKKKVILDLVPNRYDIPISLVLNY